jgi:hypothetical protein
VTSLRVVELGEGEAKTIGEFVVRPTV